MDMEKPANVIIRKPIHDAIHLQDQYAIYDKLFYIAPVEKIRNHKDKKGTCSWDV